MKKRTKNTLLSALCCGLVATATVGVTVGVTANAESTRTKPTGTNTATLTQAINDADLDTFQVYGASTRTKEPVGFRFLATIESSDLALIPNTAEFGMLLVPYNKLGDNVLTENTDNVFVAPALVDTAAEEVPANGLGYYITLMGETLEDAFPENLYDTVLAARAYAQYTYTSNGETVTDYAYSAETIYRSIAYVASCELTNLEDKGTPDTDSSSYLNTIISQTTTSATLSLSATELTVGESATATLNNATDGVNAYAYNLSSSNGSVAIINASGEVEAIGAGTTTITATIGATNISTEITVVGEKEPVAFADGNILYSTQDGVIFMPDGLLDEGETIVSAIGTTDSVDYFNKGTWDALALTDDEIKANATQETSLNVETSDGDLFTVNAISYAGVIDELSDFPVFFNNEATSAGIAPTTYGYYVIVKNIGALTDDLAMTQCDDTDYTANCGFSGVVDGLGHTVQFNLTSGALFGMILGSCTIQNLAVIYTDNTTGEFGAFGFITHGTPQIVNCYVAKQNNRYLKATTYGLMARPNGKLVLKNSVVFGSNVTMDNTSYTESNTISADSENAFAIWCRSTSYVINTNFTESSTNGVLTSDLSVLDSNYWTTTDNKPAWKGLADTAVSAYEAKYVELIEEKALYSTLDNEFFLPDSMGLTMSDIEQVTNADGTLTYYENGQWTRSFALTSAQIQANEICETEIKVYDGECNYFLTVASYAGVIDELSDLNTFFDTKKDGVAADAQVNTYGYYVLIKNLDDVDTVVTMNHTTGYGWGNSGFLGVLDGMGHKISCTLKGYLLGNELGNCLIKDIALTIKLVATGEAAGSVSGNVGILADLCNKGTPVIQNAYFEVLGEVPTYTGEAAWYIMARPRTNLVLNNVVVHGNHLTKTQTATDYQISTSSTNAFVVWARSALVGAGQTTNFTEISTNGALTSDLSVLDSNYWTTTDNKPSWKGLADTAVTSVGELEVAQQYLVENGVTTYAIILPEGADDNLTLAKDELVYFFEDATGATLTVATDGAYDTYSTYISIGDTQAFAASGIALGDVNSQGYCINTRDNMIYINASNTLGCIYGVYGLLNELFGYEQYSVDCYTLDSAATVEVPALDITDNPDFEVRRPVSGTVTADDTYANRMLMADKQYILPLGDYRYNDGAGWRTEHNVLEILPIAYWTEQGKSNWFAESGNQLCYTAHGNPDDYNAMVEQIVDVISLTLGSDTFLTEEYAEAKYIVLSSEDGNGVCTCSACQTAKSTYGSDAGAVLKLCNDVREGIENWMSTANEKYRRDITLLFLAYNDYFEAPVTLNAETGKYELNGGLTMRSDVGVWFAGSSYAHYYYDINNSINADFKVAAQKWADVANASGSPLCLWTYSLNNNEYMIHTDMYGENAFYNTNAYQFFESLGVDLYYNQGPWNATSTVTAFNRLNIYLDSQLMWDSTQSVTELTTKYFNAMYGAGASYMKQLYDAENTASRELFDPEIEGVPNDQVSNSFTAWISIMSSSKLSTWLGYITSAKDAINADTTLTAEQKAAYIDRINEEWIAVKYWQMRYHGTSIKDAAKAEFREVLGYDESTGTYAKDVTLGERYTYTLVEWIGNNFEAP